MEKRYFCAVIVAGLLLNISFAADTAVEERVQQIKNVIARNENYDMQETLTGFINKHYDDANLPEALYEVANEFWFMGDYTRSQELYQYIIDKAPQSQFYYLARLWSIGCDFHLGNKTQAYKSLDVFIADFADSPKLSGWLYELGNSCWSRAKYNDSKAIYEKITVHCSKSDEYFLAKVWIIGADYWLNDYNQAHKDTEYLMNEFSDKLMLQKALRQLGDSLYAKYDYAEARQLYDNALALGRISTEYDVADIKRIACDDKLNSGQIADTEKTAKSIVGQDSNSGIIKAIYQIAKDFQEAGSYEQAKLFYQIIVDDSNNSDAAIQLATLKIYEMIDEGDYEAVITAVSHMNTNFAGHPMLCPQLNYIAEKCDVADGNAVAVAIYRQIIQDCAGNADLVVTAKARLERDRLFSAIEEGSKAELEAMIRQIGSQLTCGIDSRSIHLNTLGQECYLRGRRGQAKHDTNRLKDYFETAVLLWKRVFVECPNSPLAPAACFSAAAVSAQELDDYAAAVDYFQKVADDWPRYEYAAWAQLKVGNYLEEMAKTGQFANQDATLLITEAYEAVINNYPDSKWVGQAKHRLKHYVIIPADANDLCKKPM